MPVKLNFGTVFPWREPGDMIVTYEWNWHLCIVKIHKDPAFRVKRWMGDHWDNKAGLVIYAWHEINCTVDLNRAIRAMDWVNSSGEYAPGVPAWFEEFRKVWLAQPWELKAHTITADMIAAGAITPDKIKAGDVVFNDQIGHLLTASGFKQMPVGQNGEFIVPKDHSPWKALKEMLKEAPAQKPVIMGMDYAKLEEKVLANMLAQASGKGNIIDEIIQASGAKMLHTGASMMMGKKPKVLKFPITVGHHLFKDEPSFDGGSPAYAKLDVEKLYEAISLLLDNNLDTAWVKEIEDVHVSLDIKVKKFVVAVCFADPMNENFLSQKTFKVDYEDVT